MHLLSLQSPSTLRLCTDWATQNQTPHLSSRSSQFIWWNTIIDLFAVLSGHNTTIFFFLLGEVGIEALRGGFGVLVGKTEKIKNLPLLEANIKTFHHKIINIGLDNGPIFSLLRYPYFLTDWRIFSFIYYFWHSERCRFLRYFLLSLFQRSA